MSLEQEIVNKLTDLLNQEKVALQSANFVKVENLAIEKERIAKILKESSISIPANSLKAIQRMTRQNDILYDASLAGMKQALHRISEVRQSFGQLKTYNTRSQISTERTTRSEVSKRV